MYYLQENRGGSWSDIYSHSDYNYLLDMKDIYVKKNPYYKYRVIEVIVRV